VRFPGVAPLIRNVPSRKADFTGRGVVLEEIRDKLAGGGEAGVRVQALHGLGGAGKSQLALEYAHRFLADYDLVWWIPSERAEEIGLALAELAGQMGHLVGDNIAEAVTAARDSLRRDGGRRWLLVFDNADDPEALAPFLPAGSGHIIITSRNRAWAVCQMPWNWMSSPGRKASPTCSGTSPGSAVTLRAAGHDDAARALRDLALDGFSRILGPLHPHHASLREWRRIDLDLDALPI
jgi:hypothetical protein